MSPQQSREQEILKGALQAYEEAPKRQILRPEHEELDVPLKWSPLDVPGDIIKSTFRLAKSLFYELPVSMGTEVVREFRTPTALKDIGWMLKYGKAETAATLGEAVIHKYKTGEWVHDPAGVTLDLLTLVSAGGGTIATVGNLMKSAAGANQLAGAAQKASRLASLGDKFIRMGEAIQQAPARYAKIAIDKGLLKASAGRISLPKWRELHQQIKRPEMGRAAVLYERDVRVFGKAIRGFTDKEAALYNRFNVFGIPAVLVGRFPRIENALQKGRRLARISELVFTKRAALTPNQVARAQVRRAAIEIQTLKPGIPRAKAMQMAQNIIARAAVKPFYRPNIIRRGGGVKIGEMASDIMGGGRWRVEGKVGALEELKGAKGYSRDPREYVPAMIRATRQAEARLRMTEQILERPGLKKAIPGTEYEKLIPKALPAGFWRRYHKDPIRADALKSITDPTVQRFLRGEYLEEYASVAGKTIEKLLRFSDWFNRKLSRLYTVYNIGWLEGQYIGNAFMSTIAGWDLRGLALAWKGRMPAEVMARPGMGELIGSFGPMRFLRAVGNTSGKVGNYADMMGRAGVLTAHAAGKMKTVAVAGEGSMQTLGRIMEAPIQTANIQVKMRLLKEGAARMNVASVRLEKELRSLEKTIQGTGDYGTRGNLTALWAMKKHKQNELVNDIINDMRKSGELGRRIPELQPLMELATESVNRANAFFGEYLGLSAFEEKFFRRLWLFYPWSKAMAMLAFKLPFIAPGRTFFWHQFGRVLMTMTEDPELPEWYRERIPIHVFEDGRITWLKYSKWSPFGTLGISRLWGVSYPSFVDPFQRVPLIALILKGAGMKTEFDTGLIPYGTQAVNVWDGSINEFTADGKIVKKIQQPPLMASLLHLLPQTQWIEHWLAPYYSKKYDVLGMPHPALDSEGNPKYPIELQDTVAEMLGVGLQTRSREDILRSQQIKIKHALLELRKQYRTADEEERVMIRRIFEDYSSGKYRRLGREY